MSSSNSPCAACKCLRRKCTQECVFAPYFPPDQPQKFINVHKVFGASNVAKLLNELNAAQREDAVHSLAYEAQYRLQDPVYGCVGLISGLQNHLKQLNQELSLAKKELAGYIGPSALLPAAYIPQHQGYMPPQHHPGAGANPSAAMMPYNMQQMMGGLPAAGMVNPSSRLAGTGGGAPLMIREPQQHQHPQHQQQQQLYEAQQFAAAVAREQQQDMYRTYEQHQLSQQELMKYGNAGGFDGAAMVAGYNPNLNPSPNADVNPNAMNSAVMSPSLALGSYNEGMAYQQIDNPNSQQLEHSQYHQFQLQSQRMLQQQQQQQAAASQPVATPQPPLHSLSSQQQQGLGDNSEEGRS